jgi:phosphohistidine phosphatase SixA
MHQITMDDDTLAFVLRHAEAGERSAWRRPDQERPLTLVGQKQSQALVEQLAGIAFKRLVSSPYLRCRQTLQPLAEARGMAIEIRDELAEGGRPEDVEKIVVDAATGGSVIACVHGDGMTRLIGSLAERGVPLDSDPSNHAKGSIWVLRITDSEIVSARYQPPLLS